jgi:Na+/H+ antiporter NhaA
VLVFIRAETTGGLVLLAAALAALLWANGPVRASYDALWETRIGLGPGPLELTGDLRHLVNDGLMTLFFFVVGLEIKRELVVGDLRDRRAAALPLLAALGGVLLPAAVFLSVTGGGEARSGWGIPIATDIAFAVGVLALLGRRVPAGAKLLLLSIAIVDDVIAILVIALFYSTAPSTTWLSVGLAGTAAVVGLRRLGVSHIWPYAVVGMATWYAVYQSGVHATIAGVLIGLLVATRAAAPPTEIDTYARALAEDPATAQQARLTRLAATATVSANERIQYALHPWTSYVIVPVFAFANAGVRLDGETLRQAAGSPVTIGVVVALVVGKSVGITSSTLLALRLRVGVLPGEIRRGQLAGGATLAGIGFTVALFISDLAFDDPALREQAVVGVLAGSMLAALLGAAIFRFLGDRGGVCAPPGAAEELPTLPPRPWYEPVG